MIVVDKVLLVIGTYAVPALWSFVAAVRTFVTKERFEAILEPLGNAGSRAGYA